MLAEQAREKLGAGRAAIEDTTRCSAVSLNWSSSSASG
jgi:hypothetical protein